MNNSETSDAKSPNQPLSSGTAKDLADSMWAMLNQASSTCSLEVTQDLALKMVKVLAEVNANQPAAANVVHSDSTQKLSMTTPGNEPRQEIIHSAPRMQVDAAEFWNELPPIESNVPARKQIPPTTRNSKPALDRNQARGNEFWTELPEIVSENKLPSAPLESTRNSQIRPQGNLTSRAIAQRQTIPQPQSISQVIPQGEEYSFRQPVLNSDLQNKTLDSTARNRTPQNKLPLPKLPVKLPPVPSNPVSSPEMEKRVETSSVSERMSPRPHHPASGSPLQTSREFNNSNAGEFSDVSDEQIQSRAERTLAESRIPAFSELTIVVLNRVIIVKGTLETDYEKRLANQLLRRISGVKKVDDAITVNEPDDSRSYGAVSSSARKPNRPQKKRNKSKLNDEQNGWILRYHKHLAAAGIAIILLGYSLWPAGNSSQPLINTLVPVSGKVVFEENALPGANLTFFAMRSDKEFDSPVMTTTIQDGVFKIGDHNNHLGLKPGKYAIVVRYQTVTIGEDGEATFGPNIVPGIYGKPETSPLKIEIAENKSEIGTLKISEAEASHEMNL